MQIDTDREKKNYQQEKRKRNISTKPTLSANIFISVLRAASNSLNLNPLPPNPLCCDVPIEMGRSDSVLKEHMQHSGCTEGAEQVIFKRIRR